MGRKPCCSKEGLNRGAWNAHEDNILVSYIKAHGEGHWGTLPIRAGLKRCGKSCRLRWLNYLRPGIKRGNISDDEEDLIIRLHKLLGNRWSLIAGRLPGRTDNEIKNYWNTTLMKRVQGRPHKPSKPKSLSHPNGKKDADTTATAPSSCSPRPPHESEGLIRTKALRCTRTFFYQPEGTYPPNPAQANGVKGSESSYHAACIFGAAMDDPANALPTCADAATDLNSWGPVVDEVVPWDRDVGGAVDLGFCSEDVALDVAELDNWMEDYWCFQPDSGLNAQSLDSLLDLEDPYWI